MNPGKFKFAPFKDAGVTGRLEVSIWTTANPAVVKLVHSKMRGQGYPENNWEAFHKRLEEAQT